MQSELVPALKQHREDQHGKAQGEEDDKAESLKSHHHRRRQEEESPAGFQPNAESSTAASQAETEKEEKERQVTEAP